MAGVLDTGGPPPAPRPDASQPAPSNGVLSAPSVPNAPPLAPGQGPGQGQAPQTPAPTHGQTVAALRHFDAIQKELEALLKDPAIGKSDVKKKVIDGVANLVSSRIITPGAAVGQLGDFPDQPFQQKKWLQTHLMQAQQAKIAVLNHHGAAYGGMPEGMVNKTSDPDDHLDDMAALHSQYGGKGG